MDPLDLHALAARISRPDDHARVAARDRLRAAGSPPNALGRVGDVATWLAGVRSGLAGGLAAGREGGLTAGVEGDLTASGADRPISRVRLLVVAADHGIAEAGVSAQPPGATSRSVRTLVAGAGPVAAAARIVGASLRVVDAGVAAGVEADAGVDTGPDAGVDAAAGTGGLPSAVIATGVRRGSGRIDREPALSPADAEHAFLAGVRLADAQADEGIDLLLVASIGRGGTTPAAAVVGALADADAASVVGRGSGIDDRAWMRKCAAVRDALRRARLVAKDPLGLLAAAGGGDLAVLCGLLLQAAARRTPTVLDGLGPAAAALLAYGVAPAAADWWLAAQRYPEPAYDKALALLALDPLLDLGLRHADGLGGVLTVPLIRASAALLAE